MLGVLPDLGRLVAALLGLKPELQNAASDNLFVGIDSGKTDILRRLAGPPHRRRPPPRSSNAPSSSSGRRLPDGVLVCRA
jgi:ABC-type amino acid transport substrate-binding protein